MTSGVVNPKRKQTRLRPARLAIAGLAALIAAGDHAGATGDRSKRSVESIESRTAGEPIMAIVALRNQRITVYDAQGGSCGRRCLAAVRDARRPPASSASSR